MTLLKGIIKLHNAKEVMESFLNGLCIIHTDYGLKVNGSEKTYDGDIYLYLSDTGYISEEDGATVKHNRIAPIAFRSDIEWFAIIDPFFIKERY
jgi:hypothetical protein